MVDFAQVKTAPGPDLLTPDNAVMLFVDHQPQMFFGTGSGDRTAIINSTVGLEGVPLGAGVPDHGGQPGTQQILRDRVRLYPYRVGAVEHGAGHLLGCPPGPPSRRPGSCRGR